MNSNSNLLHCQQSGAQMNKPATNRGFTLIELMIVVAIVAILASIAYPSYREHVRKSNRVEAKSLLMQIMQQEERFKTENLTYSTDLTAIGGGYLNPQPTDNGHYTVSAAQCAGGLPLTTCVLLTATPASASQAGDGNITLDSNNSKSGKW